MEDTHFKKGIEVEVSSDDVGFRGSWYAATIIRPASNKNKTVVIEYKSLMTDEEGSQRLRESVNVVQLRPLPPRELGRSFKFSEEVDAFHNDGWWEGVITKVLKDGRFSVFFRSSREQMDFEASDLRLHREWVSGKWVPPLEEKEVPATTKVKSHEGMMKKCFKKGTLVEINSDEEGFQGAWFAATVIKAIRNDMFLIEYQNLRTEDDEEFLKEEVDHLHIRPHPPEISLVGRFNVLEEVDALHNDGWWVGVISKVLRGSKYMVYFRGTNEEMEFKHSELRRHQDWINGEWVVASRAIIKSDEKKGEALE